jgi:chromatin segregation and condensation protein Rec8/ScpA/Scc1 (kleisin family)
MNNNKKPKSNRRGEIIKLRAEINEIDTKKKKYKESTKQKTGSLKKINKIDRPLANLTKMRREKTQISKIRNIKGEITKNTKEIRGIMKDYVEKLYPNKSENLDEMDKFLNAYDHPKLNQEDINHINRSISMK